MSIMLNMFKIFMNFYENILNEKIDINIKNDKIVGQIIKPKLIKTWQSNLNRKSNNKKQT